MARFHLFFQLKADQEENINRCVINLLLDSIWTQYIEYTSLSIAVIGGVIVTWGILGTVVAIIRIIVSSLRTNIKNISLLSSLEKIRYRLAVPLLIGLDFLIAADIIHTILDHTLVDLALLGGIVANRIALSYFLMIEIRLISKSNR